MSKGSARRPGELKPGAWEAIFAPAPVACRNDGRCQYAIDHGAEGLGACPPGKCCMPADLSIPAPKIDTSGECVDAVNVTDWAAS